MDLSMGRGKLLPGMEEAPASFFLTLSSALFTRSSHRIFRTPLSFSFCPLWFIQTLCPGIRKGCPYITPTHVTPDLTRSQQYIALVICVINLGTVVAIPVFTLYIYPCYKYCRYGLYSN